jgi:ATP-dependent DNA helicase RecQ
MNLNSMMKEYWGFEELRPLQREAMECVLEGRDSLVVLPTGGGKSLCFQAPALVMDGLSVVVSPLISLMKDQVDGLKAAGIPAAYLNSSLDPDDHRRVLRAMRSGGLKILYVAPERLVTEEFLELLKAVKVSFFAVDEAHCISLWGHDFRPEYRGLEVLRKTFPGAAIHAYTATATKPVRADIVQSLGCGEMKHLVGSFDRPNLVYKVKRRHRRLDQITRVLGRHERESCIVYCMRRTDAEALAASLRKLGFRALPYHAGMSDGERKAHQEAFVRDEVDIIVATVAFGMGIDKSNVRCVVHANAPKSLEHYQQEAGRAGRDGLEAECWLLHSGADFTAWRRIMEKMEPGPRGIAVSKLNDMHGFCTGLTCRHKALVNYFGQAYERDGCGACDVCLGDLSLAEEALQAAQKILQCVVKLRGCFGADYTASVLSGSKEKRVKEYGHERLSSWGELMEKGKRTVREWIEQLVDQEYLEKRGEYKVLSLTGKSEKVMRGEETPRLLKPADRPAKPAKVDRASWEGVDRALFEALRALRRKKAEELAVPAYIVFSDAALRDMARKKPADLDAFLEVHGVGKKKCKDYGPAFVRAISEHLEGAKAEAKAVMET